MMLIPTSMGEFTFSVFPDGWKFPAGGCWLHGMIRTEPTAVVVDVRAWVAGKIVYGFCDGVSRGLEQKEPAAVMGFFIFLQPPTGKQRLTLEFYDTNRSGWGAGFERDIESDGQSLGVEPVSRSKPDAGWVLLQTLRRRYAEPRRSWRQHAHDGWVAVAAGRVEICPVAPLYGCLEEPGERVRTNHGLLSINGWVAHATHSIVRVTASVDPRLSARLDYGFPRKDVAAAWSHLTNAGHSQFTGEVLVPASHPQPWGLVVGVELENGERLVAFARRVQGPSFAFDLPGELPPYSAACFGSAAAAVLATGSWRGWRRVGFELADARNTYRKHASPLVDYGEIHYEVPDSAELPRRRISAVIVNDNFTLGGAALFAFEYARYLTQQLGWSIRLASLEDGPLRARCDEAGIPVEIIDGSRLTPDLNKTEFAYRIGCIAAAIDWRSFDLVIVNTMVAFWAVHLARFFDKPALFYIHESARIAALFSPAQVSLVEAAVTDATRTVFVTEWTRVLHSRLEKKNNFRLLRSWAEIARLDSFAAAHDRDALRLKYDISSDTPVVVCLGSICDRKGQRLLVRAVEHLLHGANSNLSGDFPLPQFLLVGARTGPDVTQLRHDIAVRGLDGIIGLVDETSDALSYLRLADIYVCPSFEEGFPRALMEAAVFGLQIVTTSVCGIPEMLREEDAWLVPPGEPALLADALRFAIQAKRAGDLTRPCRARAYMDSRLNAADVMPEHAALIGEVLASIEQ